MKRMVCLLLCLALLISLGAMGVGAREEAEFYKVQINAGSGTCVEKAIFEDDELYIPASSFSRYTRFTFHPDTNTFLVAGQEAEKAFKKVVIDPATKRLAVGTRIIDLKNCYVVEGELYLPFCQMLPILNAEIVAAGNGMIFVANNDLSLAELLYDFDIHDYYFDLNKEFYDDEWMLIGFWMNSYLFDSVTNFRFDRLDFFFDSGTYEDYRKILSDYLKDDSLFEQAFNETQGGVESLLATINGTTKQTKHLYNILDWFKKVEEKGLDVYDNDPLQYDLLILHVQRSGKFLGDESAVASMLEGVHKGKNGVSVAKVLELAEYIYVCCNHVEDNHNMLDAVYNLSSGANYEDAHYRAARAVYDLYGENVALGLTERVGKEILKEIVKAPLKKFEIYELTAKTAGALWELVIPGNTGDVGVLTLHAGVAQEALKSAVEGNLETERAVEDYRLSLLLMMMASKKCYEIMAKTFEGYGENVADYRAKITKLENMIMGLYMVADNVKFDTYANFYVFEEQNREILKDGGFFKDPEPVQPGEVFGPSDNAYLDFLAGHPEYAYYALLDINGDGVEELLAAEELSPPNCCVDLWVYNGGFRLAYEDIWVKYVDLTYSPENRWLENMLGGTGGTGYEFIYLDDSLNAGWTSFEYYDWCGYLYNGQAVTDSATQAAVDDLAAKYNAGQHIPVEFSPVPGNRTEQPTEAPTEPTEAPTEPTEAPEQPTEPPRAHVTDDAYLAFLAMHPEYTHYALVDINQDGCKELLAMEEMIEGSSYSGDLYLCKNEQVTLGFAGIYGHGDLSYHPEHRWLESVRQPGMDFGVWFYRLDEKLNVAESSFSESGNGEKWYNGKRVETEGLLVGWYALRSKYKAGGSEAIQFRPVPDQPAREPEQPTEFPEEWLTGDPYFAILSLHPEYTHYALVDINQDGCLELLASRGGTPGNQVVDIWVDRGYGLEMMWAFIYVEYENMTYSRKNRWIQNDIAGDDGFGIEFFYMDESGYITWESIANYTWSGALYNGEPGEDWEDYLAYERLEEAYDPDSSEEIIFLPVP